MLLREAVRPPLHRSTDPSSCTRTAAATLPRAGTTVAAAFAGSHLQPPLPPDTATAGEAYFAKVLNQSKGKDLLAAAKSASASAPLSVAGTGSSNAATGRLPLTTFDEDFLQAGAVIEGARTYVLGTVFVAAHAVQLVFLKVSAATQAALCA